MAERKRCFEALDRVDKSKRLKMETLDLFLSNSVSASRVARLAEAAVAAGVSNMQEVADRASSSKAARDLRCMALKNTRWPRPYKAVITGHLLASDEPKDCNVEIMLPHEIVYTMSLAQELHELFAAQQEGVTARPDVRRQLRKVLPGQSALALSLWQDGAPFNNNREHSLEMWTMSALCAPDFRFPLVTRVCGSCGPMRVPRGSTRVLCGGPHAGPTQVLCGGSHAGPTRVLCGSHAGPARVLCGSYAGPMRVPRLLRGSYAGFTRVHEPLTPMRVPCGFYGPTQVPLREPRGHLPDPPVELSSAVGGQDANPQA